MAASALCVMVQPAAACPDACTTSGAVVTCSGNQSGGIEAGVDFAVPQATRLIVDHLTQDIVRQDLGESGIVWAVDSNGQASPVDVNSNTGSFSINVPGIGMALLGFGGGAVTVNHTGNIRAGGAGILASSAPIAGDAGAISVSMNGNIVSDATGVGHLRTPLAQLAGR